MSFGELITAMITPFDKDNQVNLEEASHLIEHLIKNESDGVLLAGTTGESATLTDEEKIELFTLGVKRFKSKTKIIAGTGTNDTGHSVELSMEAQKAGVDCLLCVTPYYNKPSQTGLFRHFEKIASSVTIPIILYNVPSRTACNISAKTVIELSKIENIIAVKEASSDFKQISEIIGGTDESFLVYSGNDGDTLPMLSLGAHGVISVASHLVGKDIKKMISIFKSGRNDEAAKLHNRLFDIFYGIFISTNPVPVKAALNLMGFNAGGVRLPLSEMTEEELGLFKNILGKYQLI